MIKSWMVIGAVAIGLALIGGALVPNREWFSRLRRPQWLTFEAAIPFIWTFIIVCGAWSATLIWENDPGSRQSGLLMGFYLLVELAILAYTPVMCAFRSLTVGTVVGATGTLLGAILTVLVFPISKWAALLLVPYLIWSPIGTYVTWEMRRLNPLSA
ncbi:TspO/MBR family protein [Lusitaniella coriacea LEGE 07157]|uniref:TspO/MBR family protein n=1 Tax=Lusitaniella coriacea LEGE 07157 TaxID=945747 RepID=A0A8J7DZT2_9CYAN|nr:TspO/MBR family protein [Lusitaniella coriacea]MBE9118716.1 TspO/MBR family protein [Lusitaniella coriacea LEGE 07157]